ncbi:MAG: hypothetical protein ACQEST_01175 [Bacteroidota bacterium]
MNTLDTTMKALKVIVLSLVLLMVSTAAYAQFEAPEIEKVTKENRAEFKRLLQDTKLTGQGLYGKTGIDNLETSEVRARLQTVYGDPTQKLEDLINESDFRPGKAIQFEYWFTINDTIPLIVLDWNGPFGSGLTYGGASKYVDLMPEIKRELARELMGVEELAGFEDYFYSPEKEQWFLVTHENGENDIKEIESPEGMSISSNN